MKAALTRACAVAALIGLPGGRIVHATKPARPTTTLTCEVARRLAFGPEGSGVKRFLRDRVDVAAIIHWRDGSTVSTLQVEECRTSRVVFHSTEDSLPPDSYGIAVTLMPNADATVTLQRTTIRLNPPPGVAVLTGGGVFREVIKRSLLGA